jgi:hypothetical protein
MAMRFLFNGRHCFFSCCFFSFPKRAKAGLLDKAAARALLLPKQRWKALPLLSSDNDSLQELARQAPNHLLPIRM